MTDEDYATLARLLDEAAQADQRLAMHSSDPVERHQARVNVDFFTAARNAARDHGRRFGTGRSLPTPRRSCWRRSSGGANDEWLEAGAGRSDPGGPQVGGAGA